MEQTPSRCDDSSAVHDALGIPSGDRRQRVLRTRLARLRKVTDVAGPRSQLVLSEVIRCVQCARSSSACSLGEWLGQGEGERTLIRTVGPACYTFRAAP